MSTATATGAAPKQGKKKLLIIVLAAVIGLVVLGGGAAVFLLKKPAAQLDADGEDDADGDGASKAAAAAPRIDPKHPPAFVPLDTFTVNLADRDAERFAQVGITLEVPDAATADLIKAFMPAVRNNILLAIADRTSAELLQRDGKTQLAQRVLRETSRALGYVVAEPAPAAAAPGADDPVPKKKKRRQAAAEAELPVKAVHFSNFIVQ
jgi:flagellar FliL protein